jgi:hypothetical protein
MLPALTKPPHTPRRSGLSAFRALELFGFAIQALP